MRDVPPSVRCSGDAASCACQVSCCKGLKRGSSTWCLARACHVFVLISMFKNNLPCLPPPTYVRGPSGALSRVPITWRKAIAQTTGLNPGTNTTIATGVAPPKSASRLGKDSTRGEPGKRPQLQLTFRPINNSEYTLPKRTQSQLAPQGTETRYNP